MKVGVEPGKESGLVRTGYRLFICPINTRFRFCEEISLASLSGRQLRNFLQDQVSRKIPLELETSRIIYWLIPLANRLIFRMGKEIYYQ
ncbi:MAG: hypothetical protein WB502_13830 [Thermoactinomyces sp.]